MEIPIFETRFGKSEIFYVRSDILRTYSWRRFSFLETQKRHGESCRYHWTSRGRLPSEDMYNCCPRMLLHEIAKAKIKDKLFNLVKSSMGIRCYQSVRFCDQRSTCRKKASHRVQLLADSYTMMCVLCAVRKTPGLEALLYANDLLLIVTWVRSGYSL